MKSSRIFTADEFEQIIELMLKRYRAMSAAEIFACPDPISLLFAWNQVGDAQKTRAFVQKSIVTDKGLVETLEKLTSIVDSSSQGRINVLKKENLEPFLDYNKAVQKSMH